MEPKMLGFLSELLVFNALYISSSLPAKTLKT